MTIFLLFLVLIAAFLSSLIVARDRGAKIFRWPLPTALGLVFFATACLSTLQFVFPAILTSLQRNRHELTQGQIWRLVSPLFVQDGGWVGTISNLIWLLLLGSAATALVGSRRWLVLYFGAGIITEVLAYTLIHQGFAGNSIANFGVAAGLILLALRSRLRRAAAIGIAGLLAGLGLLAIGNLHGAAFAVGLIISLISTKLTGRRLVGEELQNTSRTSMTAPIANASDAPNRAAG